MVTWSDSGDVKICFSVVQVAGMNQVMMAISTWRFQLNNTLSLWIGFGKPSSFSQNPGSMQLENFSPHGLVENLGPFNQIENFLPSFRQLKQ